MKQKCEGWFRQKAGDLQELSRGVTRDVIRDARKQLASLQEILTGQGKAPSSREAPAGQGKTAPSGKRKSLSDILAGQGIFSPSRQSPGGPGTLPPREDLTGQMDRAIHRAYYRDGGFRFFACGLRQYVQVSMEREPDVEMLWAAVYNTNLRPMLRQLEKLERELEELGAAQDVRLQPLENGVLLEEMRFLARRAGDLRLQEETGWTAEEYRQAAAQYTEELSARLLDRYQPPAGE